MRKPLLVLFTLFAGVFSVSADEINVDSLRNQPFITQGEEKLTALCNLTFYYDCQPDSLLYFLDWYEAEARKQNSLQHLSQAIYNRIYYFHSFGLYPELERYAKEVIPSIKQQENYMLLYEVEGFLIRVLEAVDKRDEAFQRMETLYEEAKAMNYTQGLAIVSRLLASSYDTDLRFEEAYFYYKEALKYALETTPINYPILMNIYMDIIQMEVKLQYYQEAVASSDKLFEAIGKFVEEVEGRGLVFDDSFNLYATYCLQAQAYTHLKDYPKAKDCLEKAESLLAEDRSAPYLLYLYESYLTYYEHIGNYPEALRCINQILEWIKDITEYETKVVTLLRTKADILLKLNNYKEAAALYGHILTVTDSINTIAFAKQLDNLRVRYETADKENQILKQKVQLQTLRNWIIGFSVGLIALIAIVLLILNHNKKIKEKNRRLVAQITSLSNKKAELNELRKQVADTEDASSETLLFDKLEKTMEKEQLFLDPELSRDDVARTLYSNRQYLCDAIKEKTGLTFTEYIGKLRMEHIQFLLIDPREQRTPIANLAYGSGFNSVRTFNRLFKETYGLTPGEFRSSSRAMGHYR